MNSGAVTGSTPVTRTNSKAAFQPQTRAAMRFFLCLKISEKCLKLTKFATILQVLATKFTTKFPFSCGEICHAFSHNFHIYPLTFYAKLCIIIIDKTALQRTDTSAGNRVVAGSSPALISQI